MTFNTALSGLRAANSDLRVTGNNIANASTTGFKLSRAEFGDVYASSALGGGSNPIGSGVLLADVAQQFEQGTISFTDRSLDVAINGNGFFVLSDGGASSYTRAGVFGVDSEGFIVANNGSQLQGYQANAAGVIVDGVQQSLQLQTNNQPPNQTTEIDMSFNVDAAEPVLLEQFYNSVSGGLGTGVSQIIGAAAAAALPPNGYVATTVEIVDITGTTPPDIIDFAAGGLGADATAAQLAAYINSQSNFASATATTRLTMDIANFPLTFQDGLQINGNQITGDTVNDVVTNIDRLPNVTASVDAAGVITVVSTVGEDLRVDMTGADVNGTGNTVDIESFTVDTAGTLGLADTLTIGDGQAFTKATIGGQVSISLDYPFQLSNPGAGNNVFPATIPNLYDSENEFDSTDPNTYNHATSMTVYDSQGIGHVMTQYFVKEDDLGGQQPNLWAMYVMIDGVDVGQPDTDGDPLPARFDLFFNNDGSLNTALTEDIEIINWTPLGEDGEWNGAAREPGSNFTIDITGSTQVGGAFAVGTLSQDGYSEGQLTNIEIDEGGIVQARFTNGQTQVLGQVILANFANTQGLTPIGDTAWRESFQSGPAIIGVPQAGNLGSLQSGALEDSNVELSEQLVNLIIAQRNYQANAKTIETANQVTQTIINLR